MNTQKSSNTCSLENSEDFEHLFRDNYDRIYTLAFRMAGNRDDAEDILQTAFFNAFQAYSNFRGESSPRTWLFRIVANAGNRFFRDGRKLPITLFSEELGLSENQLYKNICSHGAVEDAALEMVTRESCLQMFMNCMPAKYRSLSIHCGRS